MNANLQQPAPAINDWLKKASDQLRSIGIVSARLDAEIILAHTVRKGRTYLHAHPDDVLEPRITEIADARLALRLNHVPIAYIVGHKEFYGRQFRVTTATLIPRPESETIINLLKQMLLPTIYYLPSTTLHLVDVGTGSGCLGITAKLELPDLDVTLLDISNHALTVAAKNAQQLGAEVTTLRSDLLTNYPLQIDIIIANLPYVDPSWDVSPDTVHEPALALFADQGGTELIEKLLDQSIDLLVPRGLVLLEADPRQFEKIISYAIGKGFELIKKDGFCIALRRI